jgi:hypothetical protein
MHLMYPAQSTASFGRRQLAPECAALADYRSAGAPERRADEVIANGFNAGLVGQYRSVVGAPTAIAP